MYQFSLNVHSALSLFSINQMTL